MTRHGGSPACRNTGACATAAFTPASNQQQLEYDLVLSPGADPARLCLDFDAVQTLEADSQGDLVLTANTAMVPAGAGGAIDVYHTDNADLLVDVNGYFAPPPAEGLSF